MSNLLTPAFIIYGVFISFLSVAPVAASSNDAESNNIETVTVIGTRQAYKGDFASLETPQAEFTLSAEILRDAGALDLVQALDLSASVARQNNFGGLWNSFAVRGFVGDGNLPSNYLVNGFNAGRGFAGPRDLSGIESVEVLKGPRAALFGRGEPGGTVNLVTKRPTFKTAGELTFSAGSFNTYRTDADYTTPLSDVVAIRLIGFYEDADSFRDTIETQKQGLFPSLSWQITDRSQMNYEIEYSAQKIPQDRGVVAVNGELGVIPKSRFLGEPGDGPLKADVLGHQLEFQYDFSEGWSGLVGLNYRDTSLEGLATESQFYGSRQFLGLDGQNLSRFRRYRDYDAAFHVFRAELNGAFETAGLEHRFVIGLDADQFKNDQVALRARGSAIAGQSLTDTRPSGLTVAQDLFVINIFNPVYGAYAFPPLDPVANSHLDQVETQESKGLFIQDQISLTDALDIRVGVRFDDYKQQLNNRLKQTVDNYAITQWSPQFGVVYKASDALSFYVAYGENFRPLSGATDENNLDPNLSRSNEAGIKFVGNDGSLEGTIAIFGVEQSNISTTTTDSVNGIGGAESQGIEFDVSGRISNGLMLLASYAYVDAETTEAFPDVDGFGNIPAGSRLLNIPEHQLSLQLVKQAKLAERDLKLMGGVMYVGERNGFLFDQNFMLPSYTTVRIAASYQLSTSVGLRAEINNLLDEEHYTNSYADVWVQPGAPRNGRLAATFSF